MLDDGDSGRDFRIELGDEFVGGVRIVDIVVAEFLALHLARRQHARALVGACIDHRLLVRVLAIAQRLLKLAAEGPPFTGVLIQLLPVPFRNRGVVGGRARICFRRKAPAQVQRNAARFDLRERCIHIRAIGANRDEVRILGRRTQHGRTAYVDVLDTVIEARARLHGCLERIKIDPDQIDRLDAVIGCIFRMRGKVAAIEQTAMHLGMQRLHAAIHHLWKVCQVRHVAHLETCFLQRLRRTAGGHQIDAKRRQLPRPLDQSRLVGDRDQRPPDRDAIGHVFGGGFWGRHEAAPALAGRPIASSRES